MKNSRTSLALAACMIGALSHANTAVVDTPAPAGTDTTGLTVTPVAKADATPKAPSKAEISRGIMTSLHTDGKTYEEIIAEMQRVNGYDRQLARGTYKANYVKAGVPAPVEGKKPTKKAAATPAAGGDAAPKADAAPQGGETSSDPQA